MILSTKKFNCAKWHFLELKIQFGQRLVTLASKTKCKQTFQHTKWTKKQFHRRTNLTILKKAWSANFKMVCPPETSEAGARRPRSITNLWCLALSGALEGREYNLKPMNYNKCVLFRKVLMVNNFYSKATSILGYSPEN
jgi:hypothetical protein